MRAAPPGGLARKAFDRMYVGPSMGRLGHQAHIAVVFVYGIGAAAIAMVNACLHRGLEGSWVVPLGLFYLYVALMFWLLRLWGYHGMFASCWSCGAARLRFAQSEASTVDWRFRNYHRVARWDTWFDFQVFVAVMMGVGGAGFWWAWLAAVPLGAFLVSAYVATTFHTRYGFFCQVCRDAPRRSEIFFNPFRQEPTS